MNKLKTYFTGFILGIVGIVTGALFIGVFPESIQQIGQVIVWGASTVLVVVLREKYKMPFVWVFASLITFGVGIIPFFLGSLWLIKSPKTDNNQDLPFSWKCFSKTVSSIMAVVALAIVLWLPFPLVDTTQQIYSTTVVRTYPAVALMYADKPESIEAARQRYQKDIDKIKSVKTQSTLLEKVFRISSTTQNYKSDVLRVYEVFSGSKHWSNWQEITTLSAERKAKWELWSQKNKELAAQSTINPTYTRLVSEIDKLAREIEEIDNKMNVLKSEADKLYDEFITQLDKLGA